MIQLLPSFVLFIYCIYAFFRECKLKHEGYLEQDRLGDEHIMREIEKLLAQNKIEKERQESL